MRVVRLYTRPGCHLCEEAREAILALRSELGSFELEEVDIDSDDALHAPNESYRLVALEQGAAAARALYEELAGLA